GGWRTVGWFSSRLEANLAADLLCVGAGGRYGHAETWGPRHLDAWRHEEGRVRCEVHPAESVAEETARLEAARREREGWLVAALVERSGGALTAGQVTRAPC
ncbi:hypothetical protein, partial [Streptomyces capuensis]|uniref:hypothetical protein n=1 Tax=Streptomyces capuensis TaxID=1464056 RepID=UPI00131A6197